MTVEMGEPARLDVPGYARRLHVEARATEVVPAAARGGKADVRIAVRARRRNGAETGVVGWARRAGIADGEPLEKTPSASWTGLVADGATIDIAFEHCEVAPGVPAGFAYVNAQVTPHVLDGRHVAFDIELHVVECVR